MKINYRLCCCAIVCIVLLRIGIGWHFFYEGVHKFDPAADFSAEGFLGIAKGPTADLYYWMLPDLDGTERLKLGTVQDANGREVDTFLHYEHAWKEYFDKYLETYPDVDKDEATAIYNRYVRSLREDAASMKGEIEAFLASRERFLEYRKRDRNRASFEQQRRWYQMMGYRAEANSWLRMFDLMDDGLQSDLGRLADPELAGQKGLPGQRGDIVTAPQRELIPSNPFGIQYPIPPGIEIPVTNQPVRGRMDVMDLAVMFGLSAIGICMMLGFCTRLACLGGAAFLVNVILTTFPVPGIYPEIPSMVGNFMFVSKDVVELLALLVLVSVPSGRWGGLDYFLWNYGGKQICGLFCPSCRSECG